MCIGGRGFVRRYSRQAALRQTFTRAVSFVGTSQSSVPAGRNPRAAADGEHAKGAHRRRDWSSCPVFCTRPRTCAVKRVHCAGRSCRHVSLERPLVARADGNDAAVALHKCDDGRFTCEGDTLDQKAQGLEQGGQRTKSAPRHV